MKNAIAILLAGIWMTASEFIRNELLFKEIWIDHYKNMGLDFPSEPVNGIVWVIWSLLSAGIIYVLLKKFNFWSTVFISWTTIFVLMWLVIGNLGVLPFGLLVFAVPLSMLEVLLGAFIIKKLSRTQA